MAETPSTRSRVFWKTETFFSEYGYRPHATGVFGHQKRGFSNTLSRVEIFENGDSSYSYGLAKTEVFKYNLIMSCLSSRLALSHIRFENATCVRILFKYGGKKCPFSKILGYVWMVKYDSKSLRVEADSF